MTENEQFQEMALVMCGRESCMTCTHFVNATKCAAIVSAKKLYNAGYRKVERGEWISVEDRLPDNNGRVLVYLGNNHHVKTDTDRYFGYWARWGENVTHWVPLPEPPSGADIRGEK